MGQPENSEHITEETNIDFTRTQDNDLADNFCSATDVAGPEIPEHLKNLPEKDEKLDLEKQKDDKVFAKVLDPFANIHKEDMNLKTEEEKAKLIWKQKKEEEVVLSE